MTELGTAQTLESPINEVIFSFSFFKSPLLNQLILSLISNI